jgi:hypothetical protein
MLRGLENQIDQLGPPELQDLIGDLRQLDTTDRQQREIKNSYQRLRRLHKAASRQRQIRARRYQM